MKDFQRVDVVDDDVVNVASDDDDALLDWEQFARHRPGLFMPPLWWYQLSRRQRRVLKGAVGLLLLLVLAAVVALVWVVVRFEQSHERTQSDSTAPLTTPPQPQIPPPHPPASPPQSPPPSPPASPVPSPPPPPQFVCAWAAYRLPTDIIPSTYHLSLAVELDNYTVQGRLRIDVMVAAPTPCLVLHADSSLNITSISAADAEQTDMPGTILEVDEARDGMLRVQFPGALTAGPASFSFEFNYVLNEGLSGFYRSVFSDDNDVEHSLASTMFEDMSARQAFPCFDEPAFKAKYNMTLTAPAGVAALFNTAELRAEATDNGAVSHFFELTPPMSTYLAAWVVGNLSHVEGQFFRTDGTSVPVRVWGAPTRDGALDFALQASIAAMTGFSALLAVPYPLSKLDLVGIPDFEAGAMENWGLITFRETDLLVPSEWAEASIGALYTVPTVVAHELAHMWFGDLVTLAWWTELWLNEGFATYFENIGAGMFWRHGAVPGSFISLGAMNYMPPFFSDVSDDAIVADVEASSHPLSAPDTITREADTDALFDRISYNKGGAVLRMLHAFLARRRLVTSDEASVHTDPRLRRRRLHSAAPLGRATSGGAQAARPPLAGGLFPRAVPVVKAVAPLDLETSAAAGAVLRVLADEGPSEGPFFMGLRAYLEAQQLNVSTAGILWQHMQDATGSPVMEWMRVWTYQRGTPLISVALSADGTSLELEQRPLTRTPLSSQGCGQEGAFLGNGSVAAEPWWVPVSWRLASGAEVVWTEMQECNLTIPAAVSDGFVKLNVGQYGLFRVNYSTDLWQRLVTAARVDDTTLTTYLPDIDLAGLLSDAYALAETQQLPISIFLNLTAALPARVSAADTRRLAWAAASKPLAALRRVMPSGACRDAHLQMFVSSTLLSAFTDAAHIPLTQVSVSDDFELRLLRAELALLRADFPDAEAARAADAHLARYLEGSAAHMLHADVRGAVMQLAISAGNNETWAALQAHYVASFDTAEVARCLAALARAPGADGARAALDFALTPEVRPQDVPYYLGDIARTSADSRSAAWAFVKSRYEDLAARGGSTKHEQMRFAGKIAASVASQFATEEDAANIRTFFSGKFGNATDEWPVFAVQALERIDSHVSIASRIVPQVCAWLEQHM